MTLTSTTKLSIAEMAIYIVLLQPTLYLFYKHGRPSILAFLYLTAFMILRIVAGGIAISDRNDPTPSTGGAIVSSIGLSPMLLAYTGFLNLLWSYYSTTRRSQLVTAVSEIGVHAGAVVGIALVAVGATKLVGNNVTQSDINTGHHMLEVGAVILVITWLAVLLMCLQFLRQVQCQMQVKLLMLVAAGFIGVRAIYSVVYAFDHSPSLSPFTGTFVVKLVLIVLVQLVAAICLVAVAFLTLSAAKRGGVPMSTRQEQRDIESPSASVPLTSGFRSQK